LRSWASALASDAEHALGMRFVERFDPALETVGIGSIRGDTTRDEAAMTSSSRRAEGGVAKLKDVADAASVSVTAVSRYLGGTLSLPQATAARIDAAVRRLDYRPNPHARNLSRGRSETLGLVVPDIANPFFARMAAEIEAAADLQGYGLLLCVTLNKIDREFEYLERLRRNHIDGLVFMTNRPGVSRLARLINEVRGVVLLDEDVPGSKVHKIFCENERGGYLATRHLLEAGHRSIAFIGGPKAMLTTRERLAGYRRAIRETGPDAASVGECFGPYTPEFGRSAAEDLFGRARAPTAIFASSDEALIGTLEAASGAGRRVPTDLSLVTFDDAGPLHLFSPPITAIRQPLEEMGRRSVAAVLTAHEGGALVERLPVTLIARASVSAPPADGRKAKGRSARKRTVKVIPSVFEPKQHA
jgi:LacI family transcriptional regulator